MLELRNVTQRFGTQSVLRDVSFQVRQGETLVLIGESGCGKSVTTKLLAGLLHPTQGTVCWEGRSVAAMTNAELRKQRLRFGYLFQGAALFDSLNVFENVAFGLRENRRMTEAAIRDVVLQRLQDVGLPAATANKRPSELSGGMKKRVGLARALALSPEVMFYDEPTTGLDPVMSDVINELILRTRERQSVTSVVVTHDLYSALAIGTRVAMLHEGKFVVCAKPEEFIASDHPVVRDFLQAQGIASLQDVRKAFGK